MSERCENKDNINNDDDDEDASLTHWSLQCFSHPAFRCSLDSVRSELVVEVGASTRADGTGV